MKKIPLFLPFLGKNEKKALCAVLDSKVLSRGTVVESFQNQFAEYLGKKFAIACNSGTSALHIAVKALGLKRNDEVITTPYSFVASSNCLLYEGVKPVYVDIDKDTLNIDLEKAQKQITSKTKGLLTVNLFGLPAYSEKLLHYAHQHKIPIIEDACESIGRPSKQFPICYGDVTVFGFYPNKHMTTAEGGMFVTDDEDIAYVAKSFINQGFSTKKNWTKYVRLGYNYRMSELHAALGLVQLQKLDAILKKRKAIAEEYYHYLKKVPGLVLPNLTVYERNFFTYPIIFKNKKDRDAVESLCHEQGIETNRAFTPLHYFQHIQDATSYKKGDFPATEFIAEHILNIPFFTELKSQDIKYVCNTIMKALEK